MPTVEIMLGGRRYNVQCDDGQETRLRRLAHHADVKAIELIKKQPQLGETRVLVLTNLLLADELFDAYEELQNARKELQAKADAVELEAANAADRISERLEKLAALLERA